LSNLIEKEYHGMVERSVVNGGLKFPIYGGLKFPTPT
jgi:hypothetical protein